MLHNKYVCASFKGGTAREKSGKAHLSGHSHRIYAAKLKVFQRIGSKAGVFFSTPVLYASVLKHTQAHPNKKIHAARCRKEGEISRTKADRRYDMP